MENFKEMLYIILEMCLSIFIIFFGYAIWDSFNLNDYETAVISDNTKEVEVILDKDILYMHNIGKENNKVNLIFKVDKNGINNSNNFILEFNNKKYNIKELDSGCDNKYNYYTISNINFNEYETKDYKFKIITDNDNFIVYEFITV